MVMLILVVAAIVTFGVLTILDASRRRRSLSHSRSSPDADPAADATPWKDRDRPDRPSRDGV